MLAPLQVALPRTAPEREGIASAALLKFVEELDQRIREIHSFMLLRHGNVVAEAWWAPYQSHRPHMLFSLSKSFTSTAVGLAVAEGLFSVEDRIHSYFPDAVPAVISDNLEALRIRHLLSMSTGHTADTFPTMFERKDGDLLKGFFESPLVHEPGTTFVYNTGATYVLSALVQKLTGKTLTEYLMPRLFEPLGIQDATWQQSPQGVDFGGFGLSVTTEDIAKFGQLYLQHGNWHGQEIIPETWVAEATRKQVSNGDGGTSDWAQGYGYQFWRCQHGAYRGDGAFGQYCIVMPEQDAVLAITGGVPDMQEPLDIVWKTLLPAFETQPLTDDPVGNEALNRKIASLAYRPVEGKPHVPAATEASGRTYLIDSNSAHIRSIGFDFRESDATLHIKARSHSESIRCGYGIWKPGHTVLFNGNMSPDRTPTVASGAWTSDDEFTVVIRPNETPYVHSLRCTFADDQLLVEAKVNVSFESLKPLLLVGHAK